MRRVATVSAIGLVASVLLAACSSPEQVDEVIPAPASPPPADVTTINGEIPPGTATKIDESITLLDVTDEGLQHLVYQDRRAPGTRSPIHEHPYGGTTCVLEGQMTLYLDGSEPQVANAGECYWMPPGRPMTGVSTGDVFALMLDNFQVPPGEPVWWVVEPGMEDVVDEFGDAEIPHM